LKSPRLEYRAGKKCFLCQNAQQVMCPIHPSVQWVLEMDKEAET
jgi:RNA polymerase subunit RPABC4/transcription elongation factor Spt4